MEIKGKAELKKDDIQTKIFKRDIKDLKEVFKRQQEQIEQLKSQVEKIMLKNEPPGFGLQW